MALKIMPHGRLQEWVAEEKGYFTAEGLAYTFLPDSDYGVHDVGRDGAGERIVFLPYSREVFTSTQNWTAEHELFAALPGPSAGYDQAALT
jgi:hypothetical protein